MSNISTASWEECSLVLRQILQSAQLGVENIWSAAEAEDYYIERLDLQNWENLGDEEILSLLIGDAEIRETDSALLLPSMCFYGDHLPFSVPQAEVAAFVSNFVGRFGQAFFNGDTIILCPQEFQDFRFPS